MHEYILGRGIIVSNKYIIQTDKDKCFGCNQCIRNCPIEGANKTTVINGADNLARILAEKFSNRLFDTIDKIYSNIIPSEIVDTVVSNMPLTVFKATKQTKKSKVYKCSSAPIPYSNTASTLGRKIIQDLCGLKSFSDISYN